MFCAWRRVSCTLNLESQGLKEFSKQKPPGNKPSWQGDKRLDGVLIPEISVQRDWMSYRLGYKQTAAGYEGVTHVVVEGGATSVANNRPAETEQTRIHNDRDQLAISSLSGFVSFGY